MTSENQTDQPSKPSKKIRATVKLVAYGPDGEMSLRECFEKYQPKSITFDGKTYPRLDQSQKPEPVKDKTIPEERPDFEGMRERLRQMREENDRRR